MNKKVKIISIILGSIFVALILLDVAIRVLVTKEKFESFVLPVVENSIQKKLSIGDFSASLAGGLNLEKTTLFDDLNGTNPLIAFDNVSVGVSFFGLLMGDYRVKSLEIENPALYVTRSKEGRFNFEPPAAEETKAKEQQSGGLPALSAGLDKFRLKSGKVVFQNNDPSFPVKSFTLDAINLSIDDANADLGSETVTFEKIMLTLVNAGEVELSGRIQGFSDKASVDVALLTHDFHPVKVVRKLAPEVPKELEDIKVNLNYHLEKEGMVVRVSGDLKADNSRNLHYAVKPNVTFDIDRMIVNIKVNDLSLKNAPAGKEPNLLSLKELLVQEVKLKDKVRIAKIVIDSPLLVVERSKEGNLNAMEVVKGLLPEEKGKKEETPSTEEAKKEDKSPVEVDLIEIKGARVAYIDSSIKSPDFRFQMKDVYLTMKDVGKKGFPSVEFGGGLEDEKKQSGGKFTGSGMLDPFTREAKDLKFAMNDVSLKSFSPIAEKVQDVTIKDGVASIQSTTNLDKKGNLLTVANIEVKDLSYDAPPALEASSKLVLATLQNTNGVLRLDNIKVEGNINRADFDYLATINSALASALTNPETLAKGTAAILGGAALLPPVAIFKGGSMLFDALTGDKKETKKSTTSTKKPATSQPKKKEGGLLEGIGGFFGK